jgi:hypothetical protein
MSPNNDGKAALSDVEVLIPAPAIYRIAGEDFRLAPLPVKRLLAVVRFVQTNLKDLDQCQAALVEGGDLPALLEGGVYKRLNELLRLLFWNDRPERLTDEWCGDHLSNAHYKAFIVTALRQNELYELFLRAKDFMTISVGRVLRQEKAQGEQKASS